MEVAPYCTKKTAVISIITAVNSLVGYSHSMVPIHFATRPGYLIHYYPDVLSHSVSGTVCAVRFSGDIYFRKTFSRILFAQNI